MAVTSNPFANRQRNPLVEELLRQAARDSQAAMSTTAGQYAAEAYGGNFPIGTLTSQILKGVTARSNIKEAKNLQAQENQIVDLLKQNALNEQLPDNKYFDETGQVRQMTGGPAEGSIVNNQIQVTPQSVPSSVEVGKDSSFLDRFVNGAIDAYKIENKNQAMADVGISSDDLDLYKRQKQGTLTPVTLYRGEEAVPVLMKTDDRGSFVNYTDLKGNSITDLTGLSTTSTITNKQKFVEKFATDVISKTSAGGRPYDYKKVVKTASDLYDKIVTDNNINIIEDDINIIDNNSNQDNTTFDIIDSLQQDNINNNIDDANTVVTPELSEKEKLDNEAKKLKIEEDKAVQIKKQQTDVFVIDTFKNAVEALKNTKAKLLQYEDQMKNMNISPQTISVASVIKGSPSDLYIQQIKQLQAVAFLGNFAAMKQQSPTGSAQMGSLSNAEGDKITQASGVLRPSTWGVNIETIDMMIKTAEEAQKKAQTIYDKIYDEDN